MANGVKTVVLDYEVGQVENLRKVNIKSYFGDATRPELLHTAGIEDASMLVVAIDNKEAAKELVHYVKHTYPKVTVLARAFDKGHSYELRHAGADETVNETYYSALQLGVVAMKDLGIHPFYVEQKRQTFVKVEQEASEELFQKWLTGSDGQKFDPSYRKLFMQLESNIKEAMQRERGDKHDSGERGWTPPPKGYEDGFD